MYEANFSRLKKFLRRNKKDTFGLQLSLLAIYAEWEYSIKSAIDELIKICNEHKQIKFKLDRKNLNIYDRNIDYDAFKKINEILFDQRIEIKVDRDFFKARNKFAHGEFDSYSFTYENINNYINEVSETLSNFTTRMNEYIENQEYLDT